MFRLVLLALVAVSLTARPSVDARPTAALALQAQADSFDQEDFAGLVVLHVHSDGHLHVHIHLFGTHEYFLPFTTTTDFVEATLPLSQPASIAGLLPAPNGRHALSRAEALSGSDSLSLIMAGIACLAVLAALPMRAPGLITGRSVALVPWDPPPRVG